jgi:hypothetical protein
MSTGTVAVSPELALVDPELRVMALRGLPRLEPFDFLRLDSVPRRPDLDWWFGFPEPDDFGFLAQPDEFRSVERLPPRWVAAGVYAGAALARVVAWDATFVVGIALAIALLTQL